MAAVVDRVDGCVGSVVSDALSLIQSIPLPDQNNPLLGLPIVAIETILSFLSYDEISLLRSVRTTKKKQLHWTGRHSSWVHLKRSSSEGCILCVVPLVGTLFRSPVQTCVQRCPRCCFPASSRPPPDASSAHFCCWNGQNLCFTALSRRSDSQPVSGGNVLDSVLINTNCMSFLSVERFR